jgi:photosystem II stability/assembly factor-like uncharacterized protein
MPIYVNRTNGVDGIVTVQYATVDGTAVAGVDYTATSGTLTWLDQDDAPKLISIPILTRSAAGNYDFSIAISSPTGGATLITGGDTAALTVIRHSFGEADFAGANWYKLRPPVTPTTLVLSVQRNLAFKGTVTVAFHTVNGTATSGVDYTAQTGTLTWTDTDGAAKTITIAILAHAAGADVSFTVVLDTPTGGITIGATNIATCTITDVGPPANPSVTSSFPNQQILEVLMSAEEEPVFDDFAMSNDNIAVQDYSGAGNVFSRPTSNLRAVAAVANGTVAVAVGEDGKILFCATSTYSFWQTPASLPVATTLNAVAFSNANQNSGVVIAVGDGGVILKSSDSGVTWTTKTSGTGVDLYGVWSVSTTKFIAVGASGVILVSTNSGDTWGTQTSGVGTTLRSVWFPINDVNNGWIVGDGGVIRVTANGGTNWATQTSNTSEDLYSVYGRSTTAIWASGTNGTIRTFNGTTWSGQTSGVSSGVTLRSIAFFNTSIGYTVGDGGKIVHTINGGTTWTTLGIPDSEAFYGVAPSDGSGNIFIAVGPDFRVYLFSGSANAAPNQNTAATDNYAIGAPSATSNFGGGGDYFNTDAQAAPTSRFYMKGFAG